MEVAMNQSQKIASVVALAVASVMCLFPPVRCDGVANYTELSLWSSEIATRYWIDLGSLAARLMATATIGAIAVILLGLKAEPQSVHQQ
jgi:hypothetical protein